MDGLPKLEEGTTLTVGRHKASIVGYLSEGGFAHIYKVKIDPKEDESDIACLKRVIAPDKNGLNQLRKEVEVMKTLRNGRLIVRYYDSNAKRLINGSYEVLVLMELCPNKSLLDFMNARIKSKLSEPEILRIMFDISLGVYEMHKRGLIHRDIKIENVLIDAKENFKLCDFGSTSRPIMPPKDPHEFQLIAHDILYQTTPQYRSPEMIDLYRGFPIDEKADIWALGCFLYKLCYYTTPFEASGDIAILHASFQFLPNPLYSNELRNLLFIMLQESSYWRPNIVQVLMILASLINIPFKDIAVEDFYKNGPYNFQALQEYQFQKNNELLKQQQLYYQQQHAARLMQANVSQSQPSDLKESPKDAETDLYINNFASSESLTKASNTRNDREKEVSNESLPGRNINVSIPNDGESEDQPFEELEDLDDIEERYPSLDHIMDASADIHDSSLISNLEGLEPRNPLVYKSNEVEKDKHTAKSGDLGSISNNRDAYPSINYAEKTLPLEVQTHRSLRNTDTSMHKSESTGSQLNSKSAWIFPKSSLDKNAEKLADDIFGGNKSPTVSEAQMQPHMAGGLRAEKDEDANQQVDKNTKNMEDITDGYGTSERPPRGPLLNEDDINNYKKMEYPISDKKVHAERIDEPKSAVKETDVSGQNKNAKNMKVLANEIPQELNPTKLNSAKIPDESVAIYNPFPYITNQGSGEESNARTDFPQTLQKELKGNSNPWGHYTRGQNTSKQLQPNEYVSSTFNRNSSTNSPGPTQAMAHLDINNHTNPKQDAIKESSLIDLEVGLDSSESSLSTQTIGEPLREVYDFQHKEDSLIDLESEEIKRRHQKPHFKTKISSLHNPAQLNFKEEVIDFASDDEDPSHNSEMNRLSIRNSLKRNKSKKSGEHRRTEHRRSEHRRSHSSEHKKRLSMFGGSSV